jgi:hypothetical protein
LSTIICEDRRGELQDTSTSEAKHLEQDAVERPEIRQKRPTSSSPAVLLQPRRRRQQQSSVQPFSNSAQTFAEADARVADDDTVALDLVQDDVMPPSVGDCGKVQAPRGRQVA